MTDPIVWQRISLFMVCARLLLMFSGIADRHSSLVEKLLGRGDNVGIALSMLGLLLFIGSWVVGSIQSGD